MLFTRSSGTAGCLALIATLLLPLPLDAATVIPFDASWQFLKGTAEASAPDRTAWRERDFDDRGWTTADAPFWYGDAQPSPGTLITDMRRSYLCIFLRKTFEVADPGNIASLQLEAACDDGFIAWINGFPVARFNMEDGDWPFNYHAIQPADEPAVPLPYALPDPRQYLRKGLNVLAVQVFNANFGSSDLVFNASLLSTVDEQPPVLANVLPERFSTVRKLSSIEVEFDEPVGGVDAADLLINGVGATNLAVISPTQFAFEFPSPPTGSVQVAWSPGHGIHDLAAAANPFAGGSWTYALNPNAPVPGVMISEFQAVNRRTLHDEDGDSSDWIELHNPTGSAVNLNGWYLTDAADNLSKWRFPNVVLAARGFLVIFASNKQRSDPGKPLHTNFKLTGNAGYLALVDPLTNVVSAFSPAYPPQYEDVAYGRDRLAPEVSGYFPQPTPGAPNASSGAGFAPEVRFSSRSGTFAEPFALVLSTGSTNAVIRYVIGTNAVTEGSPVYSAPLAITNTAFVRARAFTPGLLPGPLRSESYVRLAANVLSRTSDLPLVILHNLGKGTVPGPEADQFVMLQVFEPRYGRSALTNAPDLAIRGIFHKRGSSTLGMAKASFFLETQDEFGFDRDVSVAGLPAESDWVLYAPNSFEPVLIHNPAAFEISRHMGRYASRSRFVELFLKDDSGAPREVAGADYNGIYVLEEKIKIANHRVEIDALEPEHTTAPAVTGGYLLSIDRSASGTEPLWAGNASINHLDPDYFEMQTAPRQPQRDYIAGYFDAFHRALTGPNWTDPTAGYAAYIDVPSWIDHHIHGVITFNVDALRLSGYFYKPRNGRIQMGPVWDFDRTQGSKDGRDFNPRLWRSTVPDYGTDMFNADGIFHNPWYSVLFTDLEFWQAWIDRYQELRRGVLSNTNLAAIIDSLADEVRAAQPREQGRWGESTPRSGAWGAGGYSYTFPGTYQGEVDFMKHWYSNRLDFIDTNFVRSPTFSLPGGQVTSGSTVTLTGDPTGKTYYTLDGTDPRVRGGGVSPQARLYQGPIAVSGNVRLVARCQDVNHANLTGPNKPPLSSTWSGPCAATYYTSRPALVVTEIMYHPAPPPPGASNDTEDFAFIELKNAGTAALSLIGFSLTNGIQYTFTAASSVTTLAPGGTVLLVKSRAAFQARYPGVAGVAGEFAGNLDNAGERLALVGPMQEPVQDFAYDNAWYPITDGAGFSLVVAAEDGGSGNGSSPGAWRPSSAFGGSPGRADPPAPAVPAVRINEILSHTDPPLLDAVELFNPTSQSVPLAGWCLSDDFGEPEKYVFPETSVIAAGGYLLVDAAQFDTGGPGGFALSSLGDEAFLFSGDGTNLTGYVHGFSFGATANGRTLGRYANSVGEERLVPQQQPTLGARNAGPRTGPLLISEFMYNPPPIGPYTNTLDEFVELANVTEQPQPLHDPAEPGNTWRLRGGVDFDFPSGFNLPAHGFALVVNFDPVAEPWQLAAFQAKYGVPGGTLVFGPYQGNLDNAGERVRLEQPDIPQGPLDPQPGLVPYLEVDAVGYGSADPWPPQADGTGWSLQRLSLRTYGDDPANWAAAAPTAGRPNPGGWIDTDADGLPDDWEWARQLDPYDASGSQGATGDPDQDGLTNRDEYLSGTDPQDAASLLAIVATRVAEEVVTIEFKAAAGRSYTLLGAHDLAEPVWVRIRDVPAPAADGVIVVTDTISGQGRFYRLVTPAQP